MVSQQNIEKTLAILHDQGKEGNNDNPEKATKLNRKD